ncbi:MAG TPA: tripartite tricarboxylate transporter substrate-binding protein [Burkholderiales bacterium]|nr:tripartite tricarboxylate transporter substrate-binding protein [Burkholderiales bacterium]
MWIRIVCALILTQVGLAAAADSRYPNRPIRLIVGFPAGSTDDYNARVIGPKLTERLGQPVIVDNRSGASGHLAAELAAHASPDGYTLMLAGTLTLASSVTLYPKLGYDLLNDFAYVSTVSSGANVLMAHPSIPVRTFSEFVTLVRTKPASVRYGSAGLASTGHLAMELLLGRIGAQVLHVPYKGGAGAAVALAGGEVQLGFTSIPAGMPLIQSKRLTALAVTGPKRSAALPDVPTVAESGYPGYDVRNIFGVFAPAGTAASVVNLLSAELRAIVATDDVKAKFASQGVDPVSSTPAEHKALMEAEVKQWARVVKDAKITLQ